MDTNQKKHMTIREFHELAIRDFNKNCKEKLNNQVYKIKDKRAVNCAIQAVRYVLRDIYKYYGFRALKYIINYGSKEDRVEMSVLRFCGDIKSVEPKEG